MRKKEERRKVYFCKVSSSGYQIDLYIFFFPFFNIVRQGWYNLQYIKGKMHTRENLFATKNRKKKKNRDDECVSFIKKIVYTRSRVII